MFASLPSLLGKQSRALLASSAICSSKPAGTSSALSTTVRARQLGIREVRSIAYNRSAPAGSRCCADHGSRAAIERGRTGSRGDHPAARVDAQPDPRGPPDPSNHFAHGASAASQRSNST